MTFFEVSSNSLYGVDDPVGVKFLTRLRVGYVPIITSNIQLILSAYVQVLMLNPLHITFLHCTIHASCRSVLFENLA